MFNPGDFDQIRKRFAEFAPAKDKYRARRQLLSDNPTNDNDANVFQ
jgi:hypothetical protein